MSTLALIKIRFGSPTQIYEVKVPQWPDPVYVRGGTSSDTTVLYELLVTNEYGILDNLDPPTTIIDGGANIGLTCMYFLHRFIQQEYTPCKHDEVAQIKGIMVFAPIKAK